MLVTALADYLDVDVPQLPIAVTAPEWMEQKATIDGIFAVAYGAYTHLSQHLLLQVLHNLLS